MNKACQFISWNSVWRSCCFFMTQRWIEYYIRCIWYDVHWRCSMWLLLRVWWWCVVIVIVIGHGWCIPPPYPSPCFCPRHPFSCSRVPFDVLGEAITPLGNFRGKYDAGRTLLCAEEVLRIGAVRWPRRQCRATPCHQKAGKELVVIVWWCIYIGDAHSCLTMQYFN